ncbi:hypothetical protein [Actinomycetospora atypica]|uniref:Uncharacterized protein n=1 Tax=Actinomycetospora atypica TaxID=1290095 RepID=A0ABV9YHN5_9PSEU
MTRHITLDATPRPRSRHGRPDDEPDTVVLDARALSVAAQRIPQQPVRRPTLPLPAWDPLPPS